MEDEVIKMLRAKKLEKLKEADAIEESIKAYMLSMGLNKERIPIVDHSKTTPMFPDYPSKEHLLKKVHFLQSRDKLPEWWRRGQLEDAIIEQEGDRKSLGSLQNIIRELLESKELIRIKYRNSNKLAFYTTNKELLYADENGKWLPIYESLPDDVKEWESNSDVPECSLNK